MCSVRSASLFPDDALSRTWRLAIQRHLERLAGHDIIGIQVLTGSLSAARPELIDCCFQCLYLVTPADISNSEYIKQMDGDSIG